MPFLNRPDGAKIYFEKKGNGPTPVLLIAPGGMNSSIPKWQNMPFNPWTELSQSKFTIICMDQRNAAEKRSSGPLGLGWETYAQDIFAVLDECKFEKVLAMGSCIGPSYILKCIEMDPGRFLGAVLMQPIGLAHATVDTEKWEKSNDRYTKDWFNTWKEVMVKTSSENEINELWKNMFEDRNFVFSVTPEFVEECDIPLLVLMGHDYVSLRCIFHWIPYINYDI
eukprot:g8503.t1